MDDRVDRCEAIDISDVYVFSDRAETFLLGGRMKPPGSDAEEDVTGRLVKRFRLLDENCDDLGVAVSALDTGRLALMKP
jgi:hypothetical protein